MSDDPATRALELTAERLLAYSRSGNFHSDPEAAAALGYRELVAQGMQVAGPAYALALDAWGEDFLRHGELALKFIGVVSAEATVVATLDPPPDATDAADITVTEGDRTVVVGTARRRGAG